MVIAIIIGILLCIISGALICMAIHILADAEHYDKILSLPISMGALLLILFSAFIFSDVVEDVRNESPYRQIKCTEFKVETLNQTIKGQDTISTFLIFYK